MTRTTSAGSVSATDSPRLAIPALATRMSTGPKASAASTSASTSACSETDACTATARPPSPTIRATTSRAASSSRR
jgi:hypothetical protein